MGTRRYLGIKKGCIITKVIRKGNTKMYLKCPGKKKLITITAQNLIDSS